MMARKKSKTKMKFNQMNEQIGQHSHDDDVTNPKVRRSLILFLIKRKKNLKLFCLNFPIQIETKN